MKVMSYEDIEDARAKRAAKEEATAGKGKRVKSCARGGEGQKGTEE